MELHNFACKYYNKFEEINKPNICKKEERMLNATGGKIC